jgi:hypothetical protein
MMYSHRRVSPISRFAANRESGIPCQCVPIPGPIGNRGNGNWGFPGLHKVQSFAQACNFNIATLKWFIPMPGLGPELCHDRGLAVPRPWDCVGVAVALGVSSVMVSGLASGRRVRAPRWPLLPSIGRHQSRISSLESLSTSKYPQLFLGGPPRFFAGAQSATEADKSSRESQVDTVILSTRSFRPRYV